MAKGLWVGFKCVFFVAVMLVCAGVSLLAEVLANDGCTKFVPDEQLWATFWLLLTLSGITLLATLGLLLLLSPTFRGGPFRLFPLATLVAIVIWKGASLGLDIQLVGGCGQAREFSHYTFPEPLGGAVYPALLLLCLLSWLLVIGLGVCTIVGFDEPVPKSRAAV